MNHYIVIPIFSDNQLHPFHQDNGLSLLYTKQLDGESKILTIDHLDALDVDDFSFLNDSIILTPNKKYLLKICPDAHVIYDMNLLNHYLYNKPLDLDSIRVNAIDNLNSKYYKMKEINTIIPMYKHLQYCDEVAEIITILWGEKEKINWDSYQRYNNEAIMAFYSIEREGVGIADNAVEIFDNRVERHISNRRLYTDYFLHTTAGRPSNSFGSVNFAALDEPKRRAIVPENDMLFEFDHDAYHLRLIADIVDYEFPNGPAHEHLAKFYGSENYQESKAKSFQYLYGGIPPDVVQMNPFFSSVDNLSRILWEQFKEQKYIETHIYKRRMMACNLQDMNRNKLLNYLIQATETERNIKTIIKIQRYLYKKKTSLILYNYDSFLFDYCKEDGLELLKGIMKILERNNFLTKIKMGMDFGQMDVLDREKLL